MNNHNQPEIHEVQGEAFTPLDRFWLDAAREAARQSIPSLEEAAKQMIAITSLAQTIYFAAISFGEIKKLAPFLTPGQDWLLSLILVLPVVCWVLSLCFAILVFKPKSYQINLESPDDARETYYKIVTTKQMQLERSHFWLVAGFIPLILNIMMFWKA